MLLISINNQHDLAMWSKAKELELPISEKNRVEWENIEKRKWKRFIDDKIVIEMSRIVWEKSLGRLSQRAPEYQLIFSSG